jgi:hypothetical protein
MEFQGHCLTLYLPPNKQSMPYDITSVGNNHVLRKKAGIKGFKANFWLLFGR